MSHAPKRIVFTAPERAELLPQEADKAPLAPDQVEGRTVATLVSPGTELAIYRGLHRQTRFPFGPGYAAAFQVTAVGREVTQFSPGDLALCMGGHCSQQRVAAGQAWLVPPGLAPQTAVFARIMGVSMTTLSTTTARPPATVLVTGLGPVGCLAAQVFRSCGYEVVAVDPAQSPPPRSVRILLGKTPEWEVFEP